MITANCHSDVLHAVAKLGVRGTVRYDATKTRSEVTLASKADIKPTMQTLLNGGWQVQGSHASRFTFYVVGALQPLP